MKITDTFLVPDYYEKFACKCGECRHTCCDGFTINITRDEYFRLIGLECSDELRRKLDCGIKLRPDADSIKYAQITADWEGRCHMLDNKGYCALQRECGEDVMTAPCRYFPRSPELKCLPECSCACGCERTVELLFDHKEKLQFMHRELEFDLQTVPQKLSLRETAERDRLHMALIECMQDRSRPVAERIDAAGRLLCADTSDSRWQEDAALLDKVTDIMDWCTDEFSTLAGYTAAAAARLRTGVHDDGWKAVKETFPDIDIYFEQLLVNDIFYTYAPFADDRLNAEDEYTSLKVIYLMLKLLLSCNMNMESTMADLVDICTFFFRAVEFTAFRYNIRVFMNDDDNGGHNDNDNAA